MRLLLKLRPQSTNRRVAAAPRILFSPSKDPFDGCQQRLAIFLTKAGTMAWHSRCPSARGICPPRSPTPLLGARFIARPFFWPTESQHDDPSFIPTPKLLRSLDAYRHFPGVSRRSCIGSADCHHTPTIDDNNGRAARSITATGTNGGAANVPSAIPGDVTSSWSVQRRCVRFNCSVCSQIAGSLGSSRPQLIADAGSRYLDSPAASITIRRPARLRRIVGRRSRDGPYSVPGMDRARGLLLCSFRSRAPRNSAGGE
jgi:hypothetical protein